MDEKEEDQDLTEDIGCRDKQTIKNIRQDQIWNGRHQQVAETHKEHLFDTSHQELVANMTNKPQVLSRPHGYPHGYLLHSMIGDPKDMTNNCCGQQILLDLKKDQEQQLLTCQQKQVVNNYHQQLVNINSQHQQLVRKNYAQDPVVGRTFACPDTSSQKVLNILSKIKQVRSSPTAAGGYLRQG